MDDISDLLECEEMQAVVVAIEALRRKHSGYSSSNERITFSQLMSGRFPARKALDILVSKDAGYPGQKDVLAAAFSAWLLFPKEKGVRQNWAINAILHHMDKSEYASGLSEYVWSLERDVISRYIFTDSRFLRDIYDDAGGYQAFMKIDSLDTIDILFEHNRNSILTAAQSMLYMHHGAILYREGGSYYRPSVNRACKIFEKIRINESKCLRSNSIENKTPKYTYVARSSLHKIWGESKGALALIYAARCLPATRAKSLLDVLLWAEFSYTTHGPLIPKWLGMARYVADTVFSKMEDAGLMRSADKLLAGVGPVHFPPPNLSSEEGALFRSTFRRYFQQDR